jgi:hypothetical protein
MEADPNARQGDSMTKNAILSYRLTPAGEKAVEAERSIPTWYRAVLGLVQGDTTSTVILAGLLAYHRKAVLAWIDELETLGFVERVVPAGIAPDVAGGFEFDLVLAGLRLG